MTFKFANGSIAPIPLRFSTSDLILNPALINSTLGRDRNGYWSEVTDVTLNVTGAPVVASDFHWTTYTASTGWLQMYNDTNKIIFSGSYFRYNQAGQLFSFSGTGGARGMNLNLMAYPGGTVRYLAIDTTGPGLGPAQYYLDEQHYLASGGEVLRVALAYLSIAEPVMRVLTIAVPV